MGFENYQLKYQLQQITPMIHFQHYEPGATLRASEVKPKLDKFLRAKCGENKDWLIDENKYSLDYKMRFKATGNISCHHPVYTCENNRYYSIGSYFFTEKVENKIKRSSFYENIEMTIICTIPELLEFIKNNIIEFYATHNFGFRQDKGFGSFIIKDKVKESCNFANKDGFYLHVDSTKTTIILDNINEFWKEVKNGINIPRPRNPIYRRSYLMKDYRPHKGVLNEKKAMKLALLKTGKYDLASNNINKYDDDTSNIARKITLTSSDSDINSPRYMRGLLGFAEFYQFRNVIYVDDPSYKFNISFSVNAIKGDKIIQRFPAPVYFKPIVDGNITKIYLIFNQKALNELNGAKVEFRCKPISKTDVGGYKDIKENILSNFIIKINNTISAIEPIKSSMIIDDDFLEKFFKQVNNCRKFLNLHYSVKEV